MSTKIQWTDVTDNIITVKGGGWWCKKISPGCAHCYAANLNLNTFFGGNKRPYTGDAPEMVLRQDIINSWRGQTKPKKHFVCSMTDVFGEWVTKEMAITFLRGMWRAPKQTFQVLTKRPECARVLIEHWLHYDMLAELPRNIWIGCSVENQEMADKRIPELLAIPAHVRFLSVEPMLGAIQFRTPADFVDANGKCGIHWVIFGGESGKAARICDVDWIRDGVEQCQACGVAVFVKQLGENVMGREHDKWVTRLNDKKAGEPSEYAEELRIRQFPRID